MDKRPKRRKYKDNPYILISNVDQHVYKVKFISTRGVVQEIDITPLIFQALDNFELQDVSQINKDRLYKDNRNIELTEESDNMIYQHQLNYDSKSTEDIVEEKLKNEELYKAISLLPPIQKNRIKKYYFENKTLQQIAEEEGCHKMSVKNSIDAGIKNLKEILKK